MNELVPASGNTRLAAQKQMMEAMREREALEKVKDDLASRVYKLVDKAAQNRVLPEASQLQGLRSLSTQTESIEELQIFIRYQISRSIIKSEFGEPLLQQMEDIRRQAGEHAMQQISVFLGYVYRYVRYRRNNTGATNKGG